MKPKAAQRLAHQLHAKPRSGPSGPVPALLAFQLFQCLSCAGVPGIELERFLEALDGGKDIPFHDVDLAEQFMGLPGIRECGPGRLENEDRTFEIALFREIGGMMYEIVRIWDGEIEGVTFESEILTNGGLQACVRVNILAEVL